jgi:hypothetical protein
MWILVQTWSTSLLGDVKWPLLLSMMQILEESGAWQPYVTTMHVNQDNQPKQGTCDHREVWK